MQLFLANSYFVCQMYMNGAINEEQLLKYQMAVFNSAATLIEKELPLMYQSDDKTLNSELKFKPFNADKLLKEILELQDNDQNVSSSKSHSAPDSSAQQVSPPQGTQQP